MIELVTGTPGAGKSYFAVKLISQSVLKGRVVVTNVSLVDDWACRLSRLGWHKWLGDRHCLDRQRRFERLVYTSDDLDELLRVRVEGTREDRADLVLDEAHRWLNSRMWNSLPGMSSQDATHVRQRLVDYFSGHRHYGFRVYLITQDAENIDRQIRKLFEYLVTLKNLRKVKFLGITVFPFNLFVAVRVWNDKEKSKVSVSTFGLDKSIADLYRTHSLHSTDMPDDVIMMPRPPGGVTVAPSVSIASTGDLPLPPVAL